MYKLWRCAQFVLNVYRIKIYIQYISLYILYELYKMVYIYWTKVYLYRYYALFIFIIYFVDSWRVEFSSRLCLRHCQGKQRLKFGNYISQLFYFSASIIGVKRNIKQILCIFNLFDLTFLYIPTYSYRKSKWLWTNIIVNE